ncbi:hypothetical protein CBOM_05721 [Ceraceosorus bombacis]|uniref:Uncharacterized protein n=1 Tax=Ceraceosorus bombacis TaxID=401625 RepID=A0A0P1BRN3_9BASI|nr:hypothetical protein CBOM_05721 [Ceraceosorus bombacis]
MAAQTCALTRDSKAKWQLGLDFAASARGEAQLEKLRALHKEHARAEARVCNAMAYNSASDRRWEWSRAQQASAIWAAAALIQDLHAQTRLTGLQLPDLQDFPLREHKTRHLALSSQMMMDFLEELQVNAPEAVQAAVGKTNQSWGSAIAVARQVGSLAETPEQPSGWAKRSRRGHRGSLWVSDNSPRLVDRIQSAGPSSAGNTFG